MLLNFEWEIINKIILLIYTDDNSFSMRKKFLENLRALIAFDVAEFSLMDNDIKLYNTAEVNMVGSTELNIAEKYNYCKEKYGNESTDFIFKYPDSFIATNKTTQLRDDLYETSKFNTLFLKSINMQYCCTMTLRTTEKLLGELSLYYSSGPDFSDREIYILTQFKDHLVNRLNFFHNKVNKTQLSSNQLKFLAQKGFTERELQISELMLSDMPNHDIANNLYISINTLKKHTSNIYRKLDVCTRVQFKQLLSDIND